MAGGLNKYAPSRSEAVGLDSMVSFARVVTADTYNHKIKLLDPATNIITFWLGNGKPGLKDGTSTVYPHMAIHSWHQIIIRHRK